MKAVGYKKSLPVDEADSLIDFETVKPEPKGRDIRVAVKAISANPVDYKVRKRAAPPEAPSTPGRGTKDSRLRRGRDRRRGRTGSDAVQTRRRGFLCRLDPAPGHQL